MLEKTSYNNPCPVCGKTKGCAKAYPSRGRPFVLCYRIESPYPTALAGYKHYIDGLGEGSQEDFWEPEIASIYRRDRVYQSMLDKLSVSVPNLTNLTDRGFSLHNISILKYKTIKDVSKDLSTVFTLDNVPGFYKDNGDWTMLHPQGFFIPVLTERKEISALQIRLDRPNGNQKYIWFSSNNKDSGASIEPCLHHRIANNYNTLWITEAPLKADYVWLKTGDSAIAIAGVNYHHELIPQFLLRYRFDNVILAFDMDWRENDRVKSALNHLGSLIVKDTGIIPAVALWNNYKGVDEAISNEQLSYISFDDWQRFNFSK